jgi:hypothetical protein
VHNEQNEKEAVMTVGSSRRVPLYAAVFLAAGAAGSACCTTQKIHPVPSHENVDLLRSERQPNGRQKAIAHPDSIKIRGYHSEDPNSVVIWAYRHKSTRIKFEASTPPIPDPACDDAAGECTLKLPRGLARGKQYKYTVTGKHDDTTDLDPNDPFIEVDR